ncbi:MAG TPA: hypothetical protein VKS44_17610 [Candidatus Acidoferrales bacterium]|nr:hypothetical protein [Candidatus Acidoferrales bacterium]
MATDTKGLSRQLEGRKLRLFFEGGEICEAVLLAVDVHEHCPVGDDYAEFYYDVICSNKPEKYKVVIKKTPKPVFAAEFKCLSGWELLDSNGGK